MFKMKPEILTFPIAWTTSKEEKMLHEDISESNTLSIIDILAPRFALWFDLPACIAIIYQKIWAFYVNTTGNCIKLWLFILYPFNITS